MGSIRVTLRFESNRSITMARYRIKYDIGPDYSTPPNLEDFKFNLLHQTMMPMRDILNLIELLLVEN